MNKNIINKIDKDRYPKDIYDIIANIAEDISEKIIADSNQCGQLFFNHYYEYHMNYNEDLPYLLIKADDNYILLEI